MASVLADFSAVLSSPEGDWEDPAEGRVLLNESQLVLAVDEEAKVTAPLQSVFDVAIGKTGSVSASLPGTPVTVAYEEGGRRTTAVVAADERTAEKFASVLFKVLLNGTAVTVKHPAKVGGRVMDTDFEGALLSLESGSVVLDTEEGPVTIPLSGIIDFSRETRGVEGSDQPVLVVSHVDEGEALTTVAATESARKLSILGRYLRRTYDSVLESLQELTLSEAETETLTTLYSAQGMDVTLSSVLEQEPRQVKRILHALHEKGLIESGDGRPVLTAKGQIVVTQYLERIND